jgi:hypothetical protein
MLKNELEKKNVISITIYYKSMSNGCCKHFTKKIYNLSTKCTLLLLNQKFKFPEEVIS